MKMIAHRDYRNDISDAIGIMIEEAENGHSITYEEMEGAYHKLYHKLPESLIQGQFRELCSKNTDELKALFNHQRASESIVGDQLATTSKTVSLSIQKTLPMLRPGYGRK